MRMQLAFERGSYNNITAGDGDWMIGVFFVFVSGYGHILFAGEPSSWASLSVVLSLMLFGDFDVRTIPSGNRGLVE